MSRKEFRAMLDWFMCSDPWPVEPDDGSHEVIEAMLEKEAFRRGYAGWVGAYHALER